AALGIDDLLGEDGAITFWNTQPGAGAGQCQDHADLDRFGTGLLRRTRGTEQGAAGNHERKHGLSAAMVRFLCCHGVSPWRYVIVVQASGSPYGLPAAAGNKSSRGGLKNSTIRHFSRYQASC